MPSLRKLVLTGVCGIDNLNFILGHLEFDEVDFDITCDDFYSKISDSELLLHFLATQRRFSLLSVVPYFCSYSGADTAIEFSEKMVMGFPFHSRPKDSAVFRILYNDYAPLDTLSGSLRKFKIITHMYLENVSPETTGLGSIFLLLDNLQLLCVNHSHWNEYINDDGLNFGINLTWTMYLDVLVPQVQESNSQVEAASDSELESEVAPGSDVETTRVQFPCPSLQILDLFLIGPFEEFYIRKLIRCHETRGQMGHPFKSITLYSRSPTFVETARTWLRTHEPGCLQVHVELWSN